MLVININSPAYAPGILLGREWASPTFAWELSSLNEYFSESITPQLTWKYLKCEAEALALFLQVVTRAKFILIRYVTLLNNELRERRSNCANRCHALSACAHNTTGPKGKRELDGLHVTARTKGFRYHSTQDDVTYHIYFERRIHGRLIISRVTYLDNGSVENIGVENLIKPAIRVKLDLQVSWLSLSGDASTVTSHVESDVSVATERPGWTPLLMCPQRCAFCLMMSSLRRQRSL